MSNLPSFDALPRVIGPDGEPMPQGCAWGLWDDKTTGKKDVLGTLNLLTPSIVSAAYKSELRDGVSISLNWSLNALSPLGGFRNPTQHKIISFMEAGHGIHGYDDEIIFNTQASSQWDSLMHFHHQPSQTGYNGVRSSREELEAASADRTRVAGAQIPTLEHWHARGGLVARAVFLDYKLWAKKNGKGFSPFTNTHFSVTDLEACAASQNVQFKTGDILIIRSGFTEALAGKSPEEQGAYFAADEGICGVEPSEEAARWIWNKHFAAVAGDMVAFEAIAPQREGGSAKLMLHPYLLSWFGMSIGELWDLGALSKHCEKTGRYSFLLTSAPLNLGGLVGSPPNALALF